MSNVDVLSLLDSVTIRQAVDDFIFSRRLANLSPRTVTWYEEQFQRVWMQAYSLPLADVTLPLIRERLAVLSQQVKPATVNGFIRALKAFFNWLQEEEYPVALNPRKLKPLKTEKRLPPILTPEQLTALLSQPDDTWTGKRDHCLRESGYQAVRRGRDGGHDCGCRQGEQAEDGCPVLGDEEDSPAMGENTRPAGEEARVDM